MRPISHRTDVLRWILHSLRADRFLCMVGVLALPVCLGRGAGAITVRRPAPRAVVPVLATH